VNDRLIRLLVANRGEIARRIFRTAREMGISTVAVFTSPDSAALHVAEADLAVPIESYLDIAAVVEAARRSQADAVHPGYGFLSENAAFARAVHDAGLVWVGPPPAAIEAMGSKLEAKKLMAEAGVPILSEVDDEFPLIIKASAGGGGRGMRIVRDALHLPAALESARAEAASAFGDPAVFCEPYVENGRHIEVQILADAHGTTWALGERECSLQRRHQKVVEEAPSPFATPALRARLCDAAVAAAKAVGYAGAGTVEFLVAEDERFFFLEMNTRLQVEHPVTEAVTGLDLVRLQLQIAAGVRLVGDPPAAAGHAIEARLYAEDPARDWLPQSGVLQAFEIPGEVRVDAGYATGSTVGVHYDPMLAKVIAHAPTRAEAAARLAAALAGARLHGLVTNRDLLVRVLRHPDFLAGQTTTAFFDAHPEVAQPLASAEAQELSGRAAALATTARNRANATVLKGIPAGWRNLRSTPAPQRPVNATPERVVLDVDGVWHTFHVAHYDQTIEVDSILGAVTIKRGNALAEAPQEAEPGSLAAPMPGVVARVAVAEGDTVQTGQTLLWLEAMKMEHQLTAPVTGVVTAVHAVPGAQVVLGEVLLVIEEGQ
jgi:acyl-CoA carboxylase subunit alpha